MYTLWAWREIDYYLQGGAYRCVNCRTTYSGDSCPSCGIGMRAVRDSSEFKKNKTKPKRKM